MKKIIAVLLALMMLVALTACGNTNLGLGNFTFKHLHYSDGVKGQCATIDSWHDNELGCEVHTPDGTVYVSEGTYFLFENDKMCPYCSKD